MTKCIQYQQKKTSKTSQKNGGYRTYTAKGNGITNLFNTTS